MNCYIDSSVLLRVAMHQEPMLPEWDEITRPIASELIRVEGLRTLDRARIAQVLNDTTVADARKRLFDQLEAFDLIELDSSVLERAADPFPTALGTLDALHLASALIARRRYDNLLLATHDDELATAARAMDFDVFGV